MAQTMSDQVHFPESSEWSAVMPSYDWPRQTAADDADYVYHGRMRNLPRSPSKTVRIFLSSTFTDTYTERNLLIKNVFPEMRTYCRDKYGLEFQVVDMRWGIRHEASVDHSASDLCMKEINNCNDVSLGPTFVTLLSHRYGSRPLRTRIPEDEMNLFIEELKNTRARDLEFVLEWYRLDTNALPPEYILKPLVKFEDIESFLQSGTNDPDQDATINRHGGTSDYNSTSYGDLLRQGKEEFQKAEGKLKEIFTEIAMRLLNEKRLKKDQAERYYISVTEEEIIEGVTKNDRRRETCLAFIRTLTDINLKHEKSWRFIDMTEDGDVDIASQALLAKLRDETVPQLLPPENIFRFEATWSDDEGVNERTHAQYLQQFCDTFKTALIALIDKGVRGSRVSSDKLFLEILEHCRLCEDKVERFHGREDILEAIKDYVMSGSTRPLVVWGESGCGKTSVLAKTAKLVPGWLGDNRDLLVLVRFLGTTPDSSAILQTLTSLCNQLIRLCKLQEQFPELPKEFADLRYVFKDILEAVPDNKRVVILLDSLDQLSNTNSAHALQWLPVNLPHHVKMIVSVLPKEHGILERLKNMIRDHWQHIQVQNIKSQTSHEILSLWLQSKHRKLSSDQEELISKLLQKDVRPLYLKLLFDEVYSWKSYEMPLFDCSTIESCLVRLCRRIETKHGRALVSRALGYLSASSTGLTELEMEDILSLDEDVLNDVFQFHIPPIRRLPSILWARVRRDLDEYIVDREADGTKVMAWYHRQFIEQANKRYLGVTGGYYGTRVLKKNLPLYKILRDYFSGIWSGDTPKPFEYTSFQCKKKNLTDPHSEEIRHVAEQPTIYKASDGSIEVENPRYNLRKLSELPHACDKISKQEDITPFIAKHISLNPEFLCSWIKNKPWEEVSEFITGRSSASQYKDQYHEYTKVCRMKCEGHELTPEVEGVLEEAEEELKGAAGLALQIETVHKCLLLSYISALYNPTCFGVDVAGRLLIYRGVFDGIDQWIEYCDTKGRQLCALIPPHLQLETPGSELLFMVNNHDGAVYEAMWSSNDENICYSFSSKFVAVSLELGQVLIDTQPGPKGDYFSKAIMSKDKVLACCHNLPQVYVFNELGDVPQIMDVGDVLRMKTTEAEIPMPEIIEITGLRNLGSDGKHMVMYSKFFSHLIFISESEESGSGENIYNMHCYPREGKAGIEAIMLANGFLYILGVNSQLSKLKFAFEDGVDEYGDIGEEVVHTFDDVITAHHIGVGIGGEEVLTLGTHNGDINMVYANEKRLKQFVYSEKNNSGSPKYGICHRIKLGKEKNANYRSSRFTLMVAACTSTHLLLLLPKKYLSVNVSNYKTDDSESDDGSERDAKQSRDRQGAGKYALKLLLRVKRRYDVAEVTAERSLLIAARGGHLDLFQLALGPEEEAEEWDRITGRFFTTIDAHGQAITTILTTNEDIQFMTSSRDGTLKFWMIARAGLTRKYIPNFDRADGELVTLTPGEESILASSKSSRCIYEWDIVKGRITRIFEHPSKRGRFCSGFTTDKTKSELYAIDEQGVVYVWHLSTHSSRGPEKTSQRRTVSKDDVNETKSVTQLKPHSSYNSGISRPPELGKIGRNRKYSEFPFFSDICKVKCGLIARVSLTGRYYRIVLDDIIKSQKLEIFHVSKKWQLNDRYILFYGMDANTSRALLQLYDSDDDTVTEVTTGGVTPRDAEFESAVFLVITGELIIPCKSGLVLWNPITGDRRETPCGDMNMSEIKTSSSGVCLMYYRDSGCYRGFKVTRHTVDVAVCSRRLTEPGGNVHHLTLTHDGCYVLFMTDLKMLRLQRYSDGKLLAMYTLYNEVCSLAVSTNNWFVTLGTSDKRLFTLVIADPDDPTHDDRIHYVRSMNPGLSMEQAVALLGEANAYDDDESNAASDVDGDVMRVAEKRLEATGRDNNKMFCLRSDEDSSSDSEGESPPGSLQARQHMSCEERDKGLCPTAHDGHIFAPDPCSLQ